MKFLTLWNLKVGDAIVQTTKVLECELEDLTQKIGEQHKEYTKRGESLVPIQSLVENREVKLSVAIHQILILP